MEPQLQPAGERQLLLRDDQELVVWAPLLAAWRVPALLVLPDAARMGVDAALHAALLEQQGVPLLGLLQVGGDWDGWATLQERGVDLRFIGCWRAMTNTEWI